MGVMNLQPPNLNVPLYRRDWTQLWWLLIAGIVGWLWHRPTNIPDTAISVFVGGAAIWLAFSSRPAWRFRFHPAPTVRGIWLVVTVAVLVWFMRTVLPYLHRSEERRVG